MRRWNDVPTVARATLVAVAFLFTVPPGVQARPAGTPPGPDAAGGMPACLSRVAELEATVAGLEADLAAAEAENADLTAQRDAAVAALAACETARDGCEADLAATTGALATCETARDGCEADLAATTGALATCQSDAATCATERAACAADLAACEANALVCGPGVVEYDGACVASYEPDIQCTVGANPTEVCDGTDNDCDGIIDNGCGAGNPTEEGLDVTYTPQACLSTWYNGGASVAGSQGNVFVLEFSGSYSSPGTLHRVGADGAVTEDVASVPNGGSGLVRTHGGRVFAGGAYWGVARVVEIDPVSGASLGTVFDAPLGGYAYLIAAADDGTLYFTSGGTLYRSTGAATFAEVGPLAGSTAGAALSPDGTQLYVASGNALKVAHLTTGSVTTAFLLPDDTTIGAIAVAPDGAIYGATTTWLTGGSPYDCDWEPDAPWCERADALRRFLPPQGAPVLLPVEHPVRGLSFDGETGELVVVANNTIGSPSFPTCAVDDYMAIYRVDPDDVPSEGSGGGDDWTEQPGYVPTCAPGASLLGEMPNVTCYADVCVAATTCGADTVWQDGECVSTVDPADFCGNYTQFSSYSQVCVPSSICTPAVTAYCENMRQHCVELCHTVIDPNIGWGPCAQACYASQDYCEDNFVP